MSTRRSPFRRPSMPAVVSSTTTATSNIAIHHPASTPPSSFPTHLKRTMKKLFKSNSGANGNGLGTLPAVPLSATDQKSRSRSNVLSVSSPYDDCASSQRAKSVDGRTDVIHIHEPSSSAVDLMNPARVSSSPLSSLKQRLRPKSMQPPTSPSTTAFSPASDPVLPSPIDAHNEPNIATIRPSQTLTLPIPPPAHVTHLSSDSDMDSGYASQPRNPLIVTNSPTKVKPDLLDVSENSLVMSRGQEHKSDPRDSIPTPSPLTSTARPLPAPPPGAPACPPCVNRPPPPIPTPSQLRLRVDAAALPPRLPPLPTFNGLRDHAYEEATASSSSHHPPATPEPPGAFQLSHHTKTRSMTLPSTTTSPISPRRLANASTPGTYVMPLVDGSGTPMTTTLKMTPSLVMAPVASPTPMRYPSLLVSGVSSGTREETTGTSGPMGRSRSESESYARNSPAVVPRPMRSALPALRRDGSSFYMNMARPQMPSAPSAEMLGDDTSDSDDDAMDGDDGMARDDDDDEMPASDDESEETTGIGATRSPLLGGMAKAVRAMASPFTPGTPKAGSSTTPSAQQPSSSSTSYFRPRPNETGSFSGPIPRPRNTNVGATASPIAHRKSLAASGAPSMLLSTVHDDHDGEAAQHRKATSEIQNGQTLTSSTTSTPHQTPKAPHRVAESHSSPAYSQRNTLYHTPLATPSPSGVSSDENRSTVYFDAESDSEQVERQELVSQAAGSAFTTHSTESTTTLTTAAVRPAPLQTRPSASTIRPVDSPTRPKLESAGGSNGSGESALGLQFAVTAEPEGMPIAPAAAPEPLAPQSQHHVDSPSTGRRRAPSWDYFSSRGPPAEPSTPVAGHISPRMQMPMPMNMSPRTPGGRPAMYSQVSHSMLDFASLMMPPPEETPVRGKGKEKETKPVALSTASEQSPARQPSTRLRRRSLPDMSGLRALPPPYPKFSVREEEGKEVLPPYTCRIHFEASLLRKMEFSHPGFMARDRAWKRVYVVLNGTSLTIFKHNPRMYAVKPVTARQGTKGMIRSYPAGGKKGDGVVDVEDLVVGASHVHLPVDLLNTSAVKIGAPLRKTTSRGSGGSGERPATGASASRRSLDSTNRTSRRSSMDAVGRRPNVAGGSRSSMSSSSNATSPATDITSPTGSASNMDLLDGMEDSEKRPSVPGAPPGTSSIFGANRPTNSQSNHVNAGSQLLATFQSNTVLRQFSLQNAETGLASDYHKRKNVIRVRADGEQFLLQADNVLMAIDWIETFQAGANVALDLDERPMAKPPALPRRRRRRRPTQDEGAAPPSATRPSANPVGAAEPSSEPQPPPTNNSTSRFSFGRRRDTNANNP